MSDSEVIKELIKRISKMEQEQAAMRSQQLYKPTTNVGTNRSLTTTADNPGVNGYTLVTRFEVSALILPGFNISRMRVTFEAGAAEALTITNAYIGHAAISGDVYDFLSTPAQLLFSGNASILIPMGTSYTSDLTIFNYNKVNALVIALYVNGGAASDTPRVTTGLTNVNAYSKAATNEAGTVDKSAGYAASGGAAWAVNLIESDGF